MIAFGMAGSLYDSQAVVVNYEDTAREIKGVKIKQESKNNLKVLSADVFLQIKNQLETNGGYLEKAKKEIQLSKDLLMTCEDILMIGKADKNKWNKILKSFKSRIKIVESLILSSRNNVNAEKNVFNLSSNLKKEIKNSLSQLNKESGGFIFRGNNNSDINLKHNWKTTKEFKEQKGENIKLKHNWN